MLYNELLAPPNIYYIALTVLSVWLLVLTFLLTKYILHYRNLVQKTGKRNLKSILNEVLRMTQQNQKDLIELEKNLSKTDKESVKYLQKIGFLRFNPFSDTGGDQSFILAILNGKGDGLVLSSLHSRGVTRLYAKEIARGKSQTFDLSKEEQQVVNKLLKKASK